MSEKRIRGYKKQLKFIFEKLHEGINTADYRCGKSEEEIISHSTLNDHLKFLEETGIAYEDKKEGKWYYSWKKHEEELRDEYQKYDNIYEYNKQLEHSKKLLEGALEEHNAGFGDEKYTVHIYDVMDNKNFGYLLQHLESGYPEIYKYWIRMKGELSLMASSFWELHNEAVEIARKKGYEYVDLRLVYPFWSYEGGMKLEDNVQTFIEICCTVDKKMFFNLANFLNGLIRGSHYDFFAEDAPKHMHSLFKDLSCKRDIFYKFGLRLKPILKKVLLDGEPLRGSCDRCHKVNIGREKTNVEKETTGVKEN